MLDGTSSHWQRVINHSHNGSEETAFVFLAIFLAVLAAPTAIIIWAVCQGLIALFS